MVVNKEQRIGVFVDVQNLYYSAKNLYSQKINFTNLLKDAVQGRKIVRAIAYVIKTEAMKERTFFDALDKIGFEIRAKDLQIFFGGAKKGDWDIGIAMDIIEIAPKIDVVVLLSGDGDFVPLMHHARSLGCKVEVMAFGRSASSMARSAADVFIDLEKEKGKYLMGSITKTPVRQEAAKAPVKHATKAPVKKPYKGPIVRVTTPKK
jgi:uncharacterized LabA/DUF88 family protein